MNKHFKGYYYKHQKGENILSLIIGKSSEGSFLQVLTKNNSYYIPNPEGFIISSDGIQLDIKSNEIYLFGEIKYSNLTPIKYDIMGPFKFFPMECSHKIVSMNHRTDGYMILNNEYMDFTDGTGYIEGDSGTSFPKEYMWIQCCDFKKGYSIVASVATIPLLRFKFNGCICNINYLGQEYRLATYLGVKIIKCDKKKLILEQGKYKLIVEILNSEGQRLMAPKQGRMSYPIYEDIACTANFRFYIHEKELFNITSKYSSFEYCFERVEL